MSIDVVGNFLTIVRNGLSVRKRTVAVPMSNLKQGVASILKEEGYLKDYKVETDDNGKASLVLSLKYLKGESVIQEIGRVSKPSRRRYAGYRNLKPIVGGLGISILSTSSGIMTDRQARKLGVGGEVLCYVW